MAKDGRRTGRGTWVELPTGSASSDILRSSRPTATRVGDWAQDAEPADERSRGMSLGSPNSSSRTNPSPDTPLQVPPGEPAGRPWLTLDEATRP